MFVHTLFGVLLLTMRSSTGDMLAKIESFGAHPVKDGEIPYQVSLQIGDRHVCGGSIIKPTWILTAANCVYGKVGEDIQVIAGMTRLNEENKITGQIRTVLAIVIHEKYINDGSRFSNDIALLQLDKPLQFNGRVKNIGLPVEHTKKPWGVAVASGWGPIVERGSTLGSVQLFQTKMQIEKAIECEGLASDSNIKYDTLDYPIQFCASSSNRIVKQSTCKNNSGGPLTQYDKRQRSLVVVGVTTWTSQPCGQGTTGFYINVAMYKNWISKSMSRPKHRYFKRSAMRRLVRRA